MDTIFVYDAILAHWDDLPNVKIYYDVDYSGWAKRLDAVHVCLANVPIIPRLLLYDIVTLMPSGVPEIPRVGAVVQRYYGQSVLVEYPVANTQRATTRRYRALVRALEARGCAIEGMIPGFAMVNAPAGCDLPAVLAAVAHATRVPIRVWTSAAGTSAAGEKG